MMHHEIRRRAGETEKSRTPPSDHRAACDVAVFAPAATAMTIIHPGVVIDPSTSAEIIV
jgi:hypothetical protein